MHTKFWIPTAIVDANVALCRNECTPTDDSTWGVEERHLYHWYGVAGEASEVEMEDRLVTAMHSNVQF